MESRYPVCKLTIETYKRPQSKLFPTFFRRPLPPPPLWDCENSFSIISVVFKHSKPLRHKFNIQYISGCFKVSRIF